MSGTLRLVNARAPSIGEGYTDWKQGGWPATFVAADAASLRELFSDAAASRSVYREGKPFVVREKGGDAGWPSESA